VNHVDKKILDAFYSKVEDVCIIEKEAKLEDRNMIMILSPKKA
jgi:Translation initiation factor 3 (IF-3)